MPKDNEYYTKVIPVRLTEAQDAQLRKHAETVGISLQQAVRDQLVAGKLIVAGPEQRTRNGYERIESD